MGFFISFIFLFLIGLFFDCFLSKRDLIDLFAFDAFDAFECNDSFLVIFDLFLGFLLKFDEFRFCFIYELFILFILFLFSFLNFLYII